MAKSFFLHIFTRVLSPFSTCDRYDTPPPHDFQANTKHGLFKNFSLVVCFKSFFFPPSCQLKTSPGISSQPHPKQRGKRVRVWKRDVLIAHSICCSRCLAIIRSIGRAQSSRGGGSRFFGAIFFFSGRLSSSSESGYLYSYQ